MASISSRCIWGNKYFPGFGDWYLAKTGYKSQLYDGAPDKSRHSNLWLPTDNNPGIRGSFSCKARNKSMQMKLTSLPGYPYYGGVVIITALVSLLRFFFRAKKK
jgi:hypothetical protein